MDGTTIICDDCGQEKLGELHPRDKIEIQDNRHGRRHVVTLTVPEVLRRLSGTTDGSAIVNFVQNIVG